jgi:hypothetical protein
MRFGLNNRAHGRTRCNPSLRERVGWLRDKFARLTGRSRKRRHFYSSSSINLAMCITRLEKGSNDWMRRVETGRKFWVALDAYIKRVIRELDRLRDAPAAVVRRDVQTRTLQNWFKVRVQTEAMIAADNRLCT